MEKVFPHRRHWRTEKLRFDSDHHRKKKGIIPIYGNVHFLNLEISLFSFVVFLTFEIFPNLVTFQIEPRRICESRSSRKSIFGMWLRVSNLYPWWQVWQIVPFFTFVSLFGNTLLFSLSLSLSVYKAVFRLLWFQTLWPFLRNSKIRTCLLRQQTWHEWQMSKRNRFALRRKLYSFFKVSFLSLDWSRSYDLGKFQELFF